MKNIKFLLILLIVFTGCASEDTLNESTPISDKEITEYFQYEVGNISNYSFVVSDRLNNVIAEGQRTSTLSGQKDISAKQYFVFSQQLNSSSGNNTYETLLRFDNNILEQFIDTIGTYNLIPDSLRSTLVLNLANVSNLFKYPLSSGENWVAYTTDILIGTFKINVIKISALSLGEDQLDLGPNYGTVSAEKINYSIVLNFPDMSNPLLPNTQKYSTDIWFSKELGLVKFSGSKFFTNFLVGRQINLNDTLFVESQILN